MEPFCDIPSLVILNSWLNNGLLSLVIVLYYCLSLHITRSLLFQINISSLESWVNVGQKTLKRDSSQRFLSLLSQKSFDGQTGYNLFLHSSVFWQQRQSQHAKTFQGKILYTCLLRVYCHTPMLYFNFTTFLRFIKNR